MGFQDRLQLKLNEYSARQKQEEEVRRAFRRKWEDFRATDLQNVFEEAKPLLQRTGSVTIEWSNDGTILTLAGGDYLLSFRGDAALRKVVVRTSAKEGEETFDLDKLNREIVEEKVMELVDFFLAKLSLPI